MSTRKTICPLLAGLLLTTLPAWAAETMPVGVAKVDITPGFPIRLAGYGGRKDESQRVAGRIWAKALAIGSDEDEGPVVLVSVENCTLPTAGVVAISGRLRSRAGVRRQRFVVCATHTHSGPRISDHGRKQYWYADTPEQQERIVRYTRQLSQWIEQVAMEALEARKPARLAWAQGSLKFAANRRLLKDGKWTGFGVNPAGPVDHDMPMLRAVDAQGKLMAVLVNYACHCTSLRGNFKQIHGDWAACAQEYIEAEHPGAVALVTIGCGADSDPCPHGTVEFCKQHGRALADEVKRLLEGEFKAVDATLVAHSRPLVVAYRQPPSLEELGERAGRSWALESLKGQIERGEKPPTARTLQIATWVFGDDLAMVFLSDEVVVDYALRMKRETDATRLWINAYTDDVSCYIASKRVLKEGGYEARNSLSSMISYGAPESVQPPIEDRIVERVRSLLPADFMAK